MVEKVGEAVKSVDRGDRVVVPTHLYCGFCFNCRRGRSASCLTVNPGSYGAAYVYAGMGPYRGARPNFCGYRSPTSTASSSPESHTRVRRRLRAFGRRVGHRLACHRACGCVPNLYSSDLRGRSGRPFGRLLCTLARGSGGLRGRHDPRAVREGR
ncbi:MAG: alcohol dehydrogenase catalytic domain-containing protein [Rubrobacter sp.]|nr:alcohol dehydrogenase catalytic domain-containing protein [Rubrobacter sp.]